MTLNKNKTTDLKRLEPAVIEYESRYFFESSRNETFKMKWFTDGKWWNSFNA